MFTFTSEQKNASMVGPTVSGCGDADLTDSSRTHWELGPIFSSGLCMGAYVHVRAFPAQFCEWQRRE